MTKRIGMSIATLLTTGAIGLTGFASAAASPALKITSVTCEENCLAIYRPVTCHMSDGSIRTFGNRCYADVYACQHGLRIVSCKPDLD